MRAQRDRNAFSLIEVVVALAIFSLAATVLTSSFVNALLARERATAAGDWAEDLRGVRLQLLLEPDRETAEEGERYETLGSGEAIWRAEIEPTEVVDLFDVRFIVEFPDAEDDIPREYEERLFLLRPSWSESDERTELLDDKRNALQDERDFGNF